MLTGTLTLSLSLLSFELLEDSFIGFSEGTAAIGFRVVEGKKIFCLELFSKDFCDRTPWVCEGTAGRTVNLSGSIIRYGSLMLDLSGNKGLNILLFRVFNRIF